jgi:hypothetical protein
MDIASNPFRILAASPRDDRRRLLALAEEASLLGDEEATSNAAADLANPRKRLVAEIAWMPGLSPKHTADIFEKLDTDPHGLITFRSASPLTYCNVVSTALPKVDLDSDQLVEAALNIFKKHDEINASTVLSDINADRAAAGFPEVTDMHLVSEELQKRRVHFRSAITSSMDNLPPRDLVSAVTRLVDLATRQGSIHGPKLVADLVDFYEIEAQSFLEAEEENIDKLIGLIRDAIKDGVPDQGISKALDEFEAIVENWDTVAQPIQVCAQSRGVSHEASHDLASKIRNFGVELFNHHDKLNFSVRITELLQKVFAEVGEVVEQTQEDADTLKNIAEQELASDRENKAWRQELTYEAKVGGLFKSTLRISPEGVYWNGQTHPLESINNVRWGATRNSVNGIPTGTTYTIYFASDRNWARIEMKDGKVFNQFIARLWKGACVRILTESLQRLKSGASIRLGSVVVHDSGVTLTRKRFLGANESVFCTWREVVTGHADGSFLIAKKGEHKVFAALPYQEINNVHILEIAINMAKERGFQRLSDVLGS